MKRSEQQAIVSIGVILAIGAAIAWAGSQGGITAGGTPVFALCAALAFAINGLVFIHAYTQQTEHFFDLTGSITYLTLVATALLLGNADPRAMLLGGLVAVWAGRLGSFLFARIRRDGGDGRFDNLKPSFPRFLMTWILQGLWVLLTMACALAAMTTETPVPIGTFAIAGGLVWLAGFAIEVTADRQKQAFRTDPANAGKFIDQGIWRWSRHPNYFGEITLWAGIAIIAFPALSGWQYATLISPLFVYILLTRISGIPLLAARGKKRWGDDPAYRAYLERTPALVPRPPRG